MCQVSAQQAVQGGSPTSSAPAPPRPPACHCGYPLSTTHNGLHSLLGQPNIFPTFEDFGQEADHGAQRPDEEEIC